MATETEDLGLAALPGDLDTAAERARGPVIVSHVVRFAGGCPVHGMVLGGPWLAGSSLRRGRL